MPSEPVRTSRTYPSIRCTECGREVQGWWEPTIGRRLCETCMRADNSTGLVADLLSGMAELRARAERAEAQLAAARFVIRQVNVGGIDRGWWHVINGGIARLDDEQTAAVNAAFEPPAEVAEIHAATNQPGDPT